ncbi:FDLD family class I lanthipeptide [Kribbella sp. NBC_01505]
MTTAIRDEFDLDIRVGSLDPHSVPVVAASSRTSSPWTEFNCCTDACCN